MQEMPDLIRASQDRENNNKGNCFHGSIEAFYRICKAFSGELNFVCFTPYNVNKEQIIHFIIEIDDQVYDVAGVLAQEEGKDPQLYHYAGKDYYYQDMENQAKLDVGMWNFNILRLNRAQFHAFETIRKVHSSKSLRWYKAMMQCILGIWDDDLSDEQNRETIYSRIIPNVCVVLAS